MNPVTDIALAVLLGGGLALGVLGVLSALPRWGALPLDRRIAPYLRDVIPDELMPAGLLSRVAVLPVPAVRGRSLRGRLRDTFERMLGGGDALALRLAQAGSPQSPVAFRGRQLAWGVAGLVVGALLVIVMVLAGRLTPPAVLLPLVAGAAASVAYDMLLSARAKSRRARLTDELPTMLEFLALCLSAGESLLDALRRVSGVGTGELTEELRHAVLAVHTGSPLADALGETATRLQMPGLSRVVDQIIAALEHGAPLAAVLHSQAADARDEAKRVIIERAGKKEIVMLLPLVFLILPLSVMYAIYPGLFILRLGLS